MSRFLTLTIYGGRSYMLAEDEIASIQDIRPGAVYCATVRLKNGAVLEVMQSFDTLRTMLDHTSREVVPEQWREALCHLLDIAEREGIDNEYVREARALVTR